MDQNNQSTLSLLEQLNILLQNKNLTEENLQIASKDLLPKVAYFLNDLKKFFDLVEDDRITINDTIRELDNFIERLK